MNSVKTQETKSTLSTTFVSWQKPWTIPKQNIIKTIPFTTVSERIEYLAVKLSREVEEAYAENYSTESKEINKWKDIHVHGLEDLILLECHFSLKYLHIWYDPCQNPGTTSAEIEKSILEFIWNFKRPQIVVAILKKNEFGGVTLPNFKIHYRAQVTKILWS